MMREFINRIQKMRKAAGLVPSDHIKVFYEKKEGNDASVTSAIEKYTKTIEERLDCPVFAERAQVPATEVVIKSDEDEINDVKFQFTITRA